MFGATSGPSAPLPLVDVSLPVALPPPPLPPPRPPPPPSPSPAGMGCAQGKPSQRSPARSHDRGLDHIKRENRYVPAAAARHSDPLPAATAPAAAASNKLQDEAVHARRAADTDRRTEAASDDHEAEAPRSTPPLTPPLPPQPPRREDELVDGWPTWLLENVPREALQGIVPKSADAYDKIEKVGQGTYSNVYKARERGTGRIVALKKVRFDTSESESVRFMAREMRILRRLDHPNIIRLEGIATSRMHRSIYLVFDFMYSDLTRLVSRPDHRLTQPQIKSYMQQLLSGLQHCHERGILHRDIKGSNLLIDRHGVLKIGDFGLANYYGPNRRRPLTSRVVTLWYRAPELLLGSTDYGIGIDLWSAGCLLAEMFFAKPLMPARTEVEQLIKIFTLCGSPPDDYWRKMKLPASFRPPKTYKPTMPDRFADLPPPARGLIAKLLALDPAARGTAAQALQSSFFTTPPLPCDLASLPAVYEAAEAAASHEGRKHKLRQRSDKRRESKQRAEEQHSDVTNLYTNSPNREEAKVMEGTAKPGQESHDPDNNAASSSVHDPENNIFNASSSTMSKRFSASPVQVLLPQSSPATLRRTNTYLPDSDDQPLLAPADQTGSDHGSLEIRSASMSEYDAVRRQGDLSKQIYVDPM